MAVEIEVGHSNAMNEMGGQSKKFSLSNCVVFIVSMLLGIPLLVSGIGHLANMHLFLDSVYRYQIVPNSVVPYVASIIPAATAVAGAALVLGQLKRASFFFAGILFGCFAFAQFLQLITAGAPVECGCFVWLAHETSFANVLVLLIISIAALITGLKFVSNTAA